MSLSPSQVSMILNRLTALDGVTSPIPSSSAVPTIKHDLNGLHTTLAQLTLTIQAQLNEVLTQVAILQAAVDEIAGGLPAVNPQAQAVVAGEFINGYDPTTGLFSLGSAAGAGVSSVNSETGDVVLVAGSGISVTPSGSNITIANTRAAVTDVTSTDGSVAVSNPTGPTTDLSVNGPTVAADGTIVVVGSDSKLHIPSNQYSILQNGSGGARIQAVQNTGGEMMLLENVTAGNGVILNLGAGAGGGATSGAFLVFQDGSVVAKGKITYTLPAFVNNAAAISGGLTTGMLYRTGADPDVVCIVD